MTTDKRQEQDIEAHASSGNVFADLGLPHAPEDMLKIEIAVSISAAIRRMGLTQAEAGKIIGVDQPKVSALSRGRLKDFSIERLFSFLTKLGVDVDISLSGGHPDRRGHVRVIREAA
jgi:predicted XRE-type DNA-binding protein